VKVALLTPTVETSAIGRVMAAGAEHLARRHDVEIWSPRLMPRLRVRVPVRDFEAATPMLARELETYDLAIYAVGDSPWHVEILKLAQVVPGLVVLHDVSLANLGVALYMSEQATLRDRVEEWYGEEAATTFMSAMANSSDPAWAAICQRVPMLEHLLYGSLGLVVHSNWASHQVEGITLGDVTVAPLPVEELAAPASLPGALRDLPDDALLLTTVGHVNANRRIEAIIDAIGADRGLRRRLHLCLVGDHSEAIRKVLMERAAHAGVAAQVHMTGRIDDGELTAVLQRADVCAALRDPVLEAKSASLLGQMRAARPVLVLDQAHYAELPDDVVVKVPMPGGAREIGAALRYVLDDRARAAQTGIRARAFVEDRHTAPAYADALAAASERATANRPRMAMVRALAARAERAGLGGDAIVREILAAVVDELARDDAVDAAVQGATGA
jgi:glycosyltransferase involved in cell wall biosynthesis